MVNEEQASPLRRTLLVIDDEHLLRGAIRTHFEDEGFRVLDAAGGEEGLNLWRQESPDLVLVDLLMPGIDGMAVIRTLHQETPELPVIVVSGVDHVDQAMAAIRAGAWDYVQKPLRCFEELDHVVGTVLQRATLLRENREKSKLLAEGLEALRESEKYARDLLRGSGTGIVVVDAGSRAIRDANPVAAKMLGLGRDELIGQECCQYFHPPREGRCPIAVGDEETEQLERNLITVEGVSVPILKTVTRSVLGGRQCLIETFVDISEQRSSETQLRTLGQVVEQTEEIVVITDTEGRITYANPAFERITGYDKVEVLGQNPRLLKSGVVDDAVYRQLWETITAGRTWRGRLVNRKKNGELYTEQATISVLHSVSGVPTSFVAVKRDITHELELEEQLQQAQKLEAVGTLASGIAHDFNNILSGITGYVELMLAQISTGRNPEWGNLNKILNAGNRAKELVRRILTFSHRDSDSPEKVSTRVSLVVEEALKLLRAALPTTVEIRRRFGPERDTVLADPTQLHQVVMNLCTNAWQAMGDEEGKLEISVESVEVPSEPSAAAGAPVPGVYVRLAVKDTGPGMPEEVRRRVFDPFFSTKGEEGGTGLGLSVVHGIVRDHGGMIRVHSGVGNGSLFEVLLPRLDDCLNSQTPEHGTLLPTGEERILLVDDEGDILESVSQQLEHLGYEVTVAPDGQKALDHFLDEPDSFDLVLTDLTMPKMTGRALAQKIRGIRSNIPIILCTGNRKPTDPKDDFQAVVTKPLALRDLAVVLRQTLDEHGS